MVSSSIDEPQNNVMHPYRMIACVLHETIPNRPGALVWCGWGGIFVGVSCDGLGASVFAGDAAEAGLV